MKFLRAFFSSFIYAFQGLKYAFFTQKNFRFHFFAAMLVVSFSYYLHISRTDWLIIIACIGAVMFAELINTAIEKTIDYISPEWHIQAKTVKDLAAASVLVVAIAVLVIAFILFYPYLSI